jgi:hypothetical protein
MKKFCFCILGAAISTSLFAQKPAENKAAEYAATITADDLSRHLHILAADSMQGRDTGEEGQKMAADYIASRFFDVGLKPLIKSADGAEGYYQTFELVKAGWGDVYVETGSKRREFLKDFYVVGNLDIPQETNVEVVFAGYGIETETYSDYTNIDVTDKAVLIFSGEPTDKKGKSLISGSKTESEWSANWRKKVALAKAKGATLVFVMFRDNQKAFDEYVSQYRSYFTEAKLELKYKTETRKTDGTLFVSQDMAAEIFGITEKAFVKKKKKIGRRKKSTAGSIANGTVSLKAQRKEILVTSENVLGLVEGTDKKDEVIVISAHYDHVGVENGVVYNGADDDGSGTSAVLELAQAFSYARSDGFGPRRSILFMTVSGEEKGLLGSEYYTDHPVIPLKNTVTDLNIDMIGRMDDAHANDPNYIYVIGSDKLSSELHTINEEANRKYTKLALDYKYNDSNDPNRFYYRSDHYNFAKHKIPVIFYFNGTHADYHKPTDDVEKIHFGKMEKITRLVFYTAWELANRDQRIKVDSFKQ